LTAALGYAGYGRIPNTTKLAIVLAKDFNNWAN